MREILIVGVTGNTGAALATALVGTDRRVRGLTRNPAAILPSHVTPVVADLSDDDSTFAALQGVAAVYIATPSSAEAEKQQCALIDAAARAGVDHVVLLSQLAAGTDPSVRFLAYHAAVEAHLARSGIPATVLRPNLFMQALPAAAPAIVNHDVLAAPAGDATVSLLDVRDIADVAATALLGDAALGQLDLTGPQALSHFELAAAISNTVGRQITYVDVAPADFRASLVDYLPEWQLDGLLEDYAHYRRGEAAVVTDGVTRVTGAPARSFDTYLDEVAAKTWLRDATTLPAGRA